MVDGLTNIINNAWVISIVTGVIVYIATNWFSKFKDNKEYRKNINQVTDDIVVMLQEFIVEKKLPEKAVLFSYYIATCEKYNVLAKDTKSVVEILDFLTKEILDSQFLNGTKKLEYCNIIEEYKLDLKNESVEKVTDFDAFTSKRKEEDKKDDKNRKQFTFAISLLSAIATLLATFYSSDELKISIKPLSDPITIVMIILIGIAFTIYVLLLITDKRKYKN